MKLTQKEFDRAMHHIKSGRTTAEVAYICKISERMVQRIKEAGTWERWPYIVAKATHGYNTPEYKLYLKRRHLPLTPPAKMQVASREQKLAKIHRDAHTELKKRGLLGRLFRRGN